MQILGKVSVVILPQGQQIFVLNPSVNTYKYSECCHKILKKTYQGHKYKTFCFKMTAELS